MYACGARLRKKAETASGSVLIVKMYVIEDVLQVLTEEGLV